MARVQLLDVRDEQRSWYAERAVLAGNQQCSRRGELGLTVGAILFADLGDDRPNTAIEYKWNRILR
jgi:hypothetical protein